MICKNFEQITQMVQSFSNPKRMVLAVAADEHSIEAALKARVNGIIQPVLVGDKQKISAILNRLGAAVPDEDIFDELDDVNACKRAVKLVREGGADFLMKGIIDTRIILKEVVDKDTGLGKGGVMSLFTIYETPGYHKMLTIVDGGMIPYPTLEQKVQIIRNTVDTLGAIGYINPKVGVLACVEKVNPKMPETVEADALYQMNQSGEISGCIINGPISYDCAMSKEIAQIKGYSGEVAGDVDILLAPNIHTGNIMGKMLTCTAGAKMAGIVVGAKCPIVLTSRGSTAEEKYLSIALSAAVAQ